MTRLALAALLLAVAAPMASAQTAADPVVTEGNTLTAPPAAWLGATPHFVLMGSVAGQKLDIQITDAATAKDVAELAGKREYKAAGDGFAYLDFEVALEAVIDGVERKLELEFENADFRAQTLPAAAPSP